LQPAAHALIQAVEDVQAAIAALSPAEFWTRPGGAGSVGFHLMHLAGSTDRLCTYARGEGLSDQQRARLAEERELPAPLPDAALLLTRWRQTVDRALDQFKGTPVESLTGRREVGRARIPSTVHGLLFHAAEHASRHAGQIVTTAKIVRGIGAMDGGR
jgi:uncharacterized damage-inducible protein DinB